MGREYKSGFTLIELSIVLVIIGLIVGGIMVGQDLIEVARLRGVGRDAQLLTTAVNTFQAKYACLPGDCLNATNFFPAGHCDGSLESSTAVCNGDGDGVIGGPGSGADSYWFHQWENFYFWRTLKAAQLIPFILPGGNYGMPASSWMGTDNSSTAQGSFPNSHLFITSNDILIQSGFHGPPCYTAWNCIYIPADYTNALIYADSSLNNFGSLLTTAQAQWADTKFDDGYANTGRIIAGGYPFGYCAVASSPAPVPYVQLVPGFPVPAVSCGLVFIGLF